MLAGPCFMDVGLIMRGSLDEGRAEWEYCLPDGSSVSLIIENKEREPKTAGRRVLPARQATRRQRARGRARGRVRLRRSRRRGGRRSSGGRRLV